MSSGASLNHIFRTVWNHALGAMVAVAETGTASGPTSGRRKQTRASVWPANIGNFGPGGHPGIGLLALSVAVAWSAWSPSAHANPTGGVAVVGQATVVNTGNTLRVTTQNAAGTNFSAINWQSFSIPSGSTTFFQQPDAASMSINRVVTNTPTQIFGSLASNGKLVLVNQSGIAVGAGAVVDTAGFTASSLAMSDQDAMAGRLRFGDGRISTSELSVNGTLVARSGDVVLLGSQVNTGPNALIHAPNGSAILAAGQQIDITARGLEGIRLQVQAPSDSALNLGALSGDAVGMFAGTLKHSGLIHATAVDASGGKVWLKAADVLNVGGAVNAQRLGGMGGEILASGDKVALQSSAVLAASGAHGGGEVLVGGGWQGHDGRLANASQTVVATGAQINADALVNGNGGTAVVWSDGATRFGGLVSARGGTLGGHGGKAEVSGKQFLDFQGTADLTAMHGNTGLLLLDPANLTIGTTANVDGLGYGADVTGDLSSTIYPTINSQITAAKVGLLLNSASLSLAATGNVNVTSPITKTTGGSTTLTLSGGSIDINAAISGSNGSPLGLSLVSSGAISLAAPVTSYGATVSLSAGGSITGSSGSINTQNSSGNAGDVTVSGTTVTMGSVNAAGTLGTCLSTCSPGTNGGTVYMAASAGSISAGAIDVRGGNGVPNFGVGTTGGNGGFVTLNASGGVSLTSIDVSKGLGGADTISGVAGSVGRWLVYASNPNAVSKNGLKSSYRHYGATYANYASPLETGNGFIYAVTQGTILVNTALASGVATNQFGTAPTASYSFSLSGDYDAEDISGAATFGPTITSSTNAGTYSIAYAGGLNSLTMGTGISLGSSAYNLVAGSSVAYTVTAAPLSVSAVLAGNVSKIYDGTTSASLAPANFVLSGFLNGDQASVNQTAGTYSGKGVGSNITVSAVLAPSNFIPIGPTVLSNYTLPTSAVGNVGFITSRTLSVSGITASNKVYDGLLSVSVSGGVLAGVLVTDSVALGSSSGSFADKNVATGKTVTISGLTLSGADANNYVVSNTGLTALADITPKTLNISGLTAASKAYDGTVQASPGTSAAVLNGLVTNDVVTVTGVSGAFVDKNVGTGKPVTFNGLQLGGADGGNYKIGAVNTATADIAPRALSNWIGGASGLWSNPANWDVLPDGSNVLAVFLPSSLTAITLDAAAGNVSLNSISTLPNFLVVGGGLSVRGDVAATGFVQTGGRVSGSGSFKVNGSFNQSGGTLAFGNVDIVQTRGDLNLSSIAAPFISLLAQGGGIRQLGGGVQSASLVTSSTAGTSLNAPGNQLSAFKATNRGSGNIELINTGVLKLDGALSEGGSITVVNTGGVSTTQLVSARDGSVSLTANSPLTIGKDGILAGGNIDLIATNLTSAGNITLDGPIESTSGGVQIVAANNLIQNSSVLAPLGVRAAVGGSLTIGPLATTGYQPVSYSVNNQAVSPPRSPLTSGATTDQIVSLMQAVTNFGNDFRVNPIDILLKPGNERDLSRELIVSEGQICRP